jgi:UDP-glucose 4,6-dehydratase
VKGNICSSELVNYVLEAEKIDTIMHFAAQTHVDNSFGNSFQFTQVALRWSLLHEINDLSSS